MIRIAICDDILEQLQLIQKAAKTYFSDKNGHVTYDLYDNAFDFIDDIEKRKAFDIILLDICMPGILGTDIAAQLRRDKIMSEIIFLTTSDEFAVEAFAVQAAHYLVKPFTQEQFNQAMVRALERIRARDSKRIIFRIPGGIQVEEMKDILFIESKGHMLSVYLKDGSILQTRQPLGTLLEMLESMSPGQFVSPSKGYIVNQNSIKCIKSSYIEIAGHQIPLPRGKFRQFQETYFDYIFST